MKNVRVIIPVFGREAVFDTLAAARRSTVIKERLRQSFASGPGPR